MSLIDTHAHLTFTELCNDLEGILGRCDDADVEHVITVGVDVADARAAIELSERYPDRISAAVGFHPHEAEKVSDEALVEMGRLWKHPKVVGLGEFGLDYHYDFADKRVQKSVFAKQLDLAADRSEPLVVHCREAIDDAVSLLMDHGFEGRGVVFHCFTGTADEAKLVGDHGWLISFTGMVTFRKSTWLKQIVRDYPADHLMIESDSPFLSPEPLRGRTPNEPARIEHIARFLAELRSVSYEELTRQTTRNARRFYGLPDRSQQ